MATTTKPYDGNGVRGSAGNTLTFPFPYIKITDVKVSLNGTTLATTKYTFPTATSIQFTTTGIDASVQETNGAPKTGVNILIYRDTDVSSAQAVFAAGSSIRAFDLNNNQDQILFFEQEVADSNNPKIFISKDNIADSGVSAGSYGSGSAIPTITVNSKGFVTAASTNSIDTDLLADTSPQLGGNLDLNSNNITGTGNINITGQFQSTGSGTSSGLKINNAHDSAYLFFVNNNDNSDFYISYGNSGGPEIKLGHDGKVSLSHAGTTRIETTTVGALITGNLGITGTVDGVDIAARDTLFGGLTSSSGALINGVTATTQGQSSNNSKVATTAFVHTAVSNLVDSSPDALNTLNELAAALGDDANFSTTVTNLIGDKLPLAGGTLTGNVAIAKSGIANLTVNSSNNYGTIEVGGSTGAFIDLKSPATDDYDTRFTHDGFIYAKNNITLSPTSGNVVNVARNLNAQEGLDVTGDTTTTTGFGAGTTSPACNFHSFKNDTSIGHQIKIEQDGDGDAVLGWDLTGVRAWSAGIDNSDSNRWKLSSGSSVNTNTQITIEQDGFVGLHHDSATTPKLQTSATGVDIVGNTTQTGTNGILNLVTTQNVANAGSKIAFFGANRSTTNEEFAAIKGGLINNSGGSGKQRGYLDFVIGDNSHTHRMNDDGSVDFAGNLTLPDNGQLQLGGATGGDSQIYHTGSHAIIKNSTGNLILQDDDNIVLEKINGENMLVAQGDGAVNLYYDGGTYSTPKLATTATGIDIRGTTYIQAGAFSTNITNVGGKTLATNIDIASTSARTGIVLRNVYDYRAETGTNSTALGGFQVWDPYDSSSTSYAFLAAEGATLVDKAWIKCNGTAYFAGNVDMASGLDVTGAITATASAANTDILTLTTHNSRNLVFTTPNGDSGALPFVISTSNAIEFKIDNQRTLFIDDSGQVNLHHDGSSTAKLSTSATGLDVNGGIQMSTTGQAGFRLVDSSISSGSPYMEVIAKRNDGNTHQAFSGNLYLASNRTDAKVNNTNKLGSISFGGNHTDGTLANVAYGASIAGVASDSFDSATDMPTDLVFLTGSTGVVPLVGPAGQSNAGTERMRITATGNVAIGDLTNPDRKLHIQTNGESYIRLTDNDITAETNSAEGVIEFETRDTNNQGVNALIGAYHQDDQGNAYLRFDTGNASNVTERMRIKSDGAVELTETLKLQNDKNLNLGNNNNLVIKFDSTNAVSRVQSDAQPLYFKGLDGSATQAGITMYKGGGAEKMFEAFNDGAVKLYFDGGTYSTPKLSTSASGVDIEGNATISNIANDGGLNLDGAGNNTCLHFTSTGSSPAHGFRIAFHSPTNSRFGSPALTFDKINNSTRAFLGHIAGISDDGFHLNDNKKLHLGSQDANGDLQIYHNALNSWIVDQGTGHLIIGSNGDRVRIAKGAGAESMAEFITDGANELYFDGGTYSTPKLKTTATGVQVNGNIEIEAGTLIIDTDPDSPSTSFGLQEAIRIDDAGTAGNPDRNFSIYEYRQGGGRFFSLNMNLTSGSTGSAYTYTQGNWGGSSMIRFNNGGTIFYADAQVTGGSNDVISPTERFAVKTTGVEVTGDLLTTGDGTFDDIRVGEWTGNASYAGMFHKNQDSNEYMIISNDGRTYLSATTGSAVIVRGGANNSNNQIQVHPTNGIDITAANGINIVDGSIDFTSNSDTFPHVVMKGANGRVKFGIWSDVSGGMPVYGMGMTSGVSYGSIGGTGTEYAATFQMNNTNDRGWVFLDNAHTLDKGAMSLTTQGKMTVAHSMRLGYGESDTTVSGATHALDVSGSAIISSSLTAGGLTFPTANGTDGQVLTSDGAGNVQWEDATGGGGSSFNGGTITSDLTISKTNPKLTFNNTQSSTDDYNFTMSSSNFKLFRTPSGGGSDVTRISINAGNIILYQAVNATGTFKVSDDIDPAVDDSSDIGSSSKRFDDIFATNTTIQTSDERLKQDIQALTTAEKAVATTLKGLIKTFKYKSAVAAKGDKARIHCGVIAQEVKTAFEAQGLKAEDYALFCYDEWDAIPEVKDDEGTVIEPAVPAGNRYSIRYSELLAFIISSL